MGVINDILDFSKFERGRMALEAADFSLVDSGPDGHLMKPTEHPHILIIDDDALLRGMAAATLRRAGFAVCEAASGEAGLALITKRSYDLILLDVLMGGLDGYEVCRRIRMMPEPR